MEQRKLDNMRKIKFTHNVVDFNEFLDGLNHNLIVTRYAKQKGRWSASIEHCEIIDGNLLSSRFGTGKTPDEAIKDYIEIIAGETIVFGAYTEERKEYKVSSNLIYKSNE